MSHEKLPELTPAMKHIVEHVARAGHKPLELRTPQEARAFYVRGAEVLDLPRAPLPRVEDFTIPAGDGTPLAARLYAPFEGALPVLLYFHGGGFVIGNLETHDSLCRQLALASGAAVVSVDYRLAPEYRFPTAADDAWAALEWLARQGQTLGLDSRRLAVGGDSAGGTLAAVSAIRARNEGLSLALQLLFYPGTIAHADTPSHKTYAHGYLITRELIAWFFDQYLPDQALREDWRFAPIMAEDLDGVAPAWLGLAECDPLFDEGVAYADRLRLAGVPVDLEIYRGVTHDFIKMGRALSEARTAHAHAGRALAQAFQLSPPMGPQGS